MRRLARARKRAHAAAFGPGTAFAKGPPSTGPPKKRRKKEKKRAEWSAEGLGSLSAARTDVLEKPCPRNVGAAAGGKEGKESRVRHWGSISRDRITPRRPSGKKEDKTPRSATTCSQSMRFEAGLVETASGCVACAFATPDGTSLRAMDGRIDTIRKPGSGRARALFSTYAESAQTANRRRPKGQTSKRGRAFPDPPDPHWRKLLSRI